MALEAARSLLLVKQYQAQCRKKPRASPVGGGVNEKGGRCRPPEIPNSSTREFNFRRGFPDLCFCSGLGAEVYRHGFQLTGLRLLVSTAHRFAHHAVGQGGRLAVA